MTLVYLLPATLLFGYTLAYVNDYGQKVHFQCEDGKFLSHIKSIHSNTEEDRRWDFQCNGGMANVDCVWSDYVNEWDDFLIFECPQDSVITGIESVYAASRRDRRFQFKCCTISGVVPNNCKVTDFVNDWDGEMNFELETGKALKAAYSFHINSKEDRIWKFLKCDVPLSIYPNA